ncbi:hypothetical protein ACSBR1_025954 [Camellia fascicularis]
MASSASLPIISGGLSISTSLSSSSSSSSNHHSSTVFKWGLRRDQDTKLFTRRTKGQAVRVLANPNRRREIEAINGAWAMIGLTLGLVIEGHTGNSILSQLAGYWAAIVHFFVR